MDAPASTVLNREGASRTTSARPSSAAAAPRWVEALGPTGIAHAALLFALFAWLYWDQLRRLYALWQTPDWMHGFLIPLFCLYFVNMKRQELLTGEHRGSLAGLGLMAASVAVYAGAIFAKYGYPQDLSMIPFIAGVVLLTCGWRALRLTMFPIAFLVLALPPPDRLYREITQPLQQMAAAVGVSILNILPGASVERAGVNIAFFMDYGRSGNFAVAGACSGMRSLMAFTALGLAMAFMTRRPAWQRLVIAVLVVPVALLCNFLRVVITGAFQMYEYGDLASGTPHSMLGFAMFGLGLAIYLGLLWTLDHLFVDEGGLPAGPEAAA